MKTNRFVIVVPFRNCFSYIKECANSIINQDYDNWIAIFADDNSFDYSSKQIPKHDKIIYTKNEERITALPNIHKAITTANLSEEDIICLLDGDDHLIGNDVLTLLNDMYQDETLLTYGQYQFSNGNIGHCKPYTKEEFDNLRKGSYWASHIRTFKFKLYKELISQDPSLSCYKNVKGEFFTMTYDVAIMTPLMEIAGFKRIKFNPKPIYYYRLHNNNDHIVNWGLQKDIEQEIFAKNKFREINIS
jgi:glycosyltransferase involved in cell wall biosynthesis